MAKGEGHLDRLIRFSVDVPKLEQMLPRIAAGRHIADQMMRSATAAASNYAEARSGESLRDFVHALGIVRKELHESYILQRMLRDAKAAEGDRLEPLLNESDEMCRIISASKKTVETRLKKQRTSSDEL
jgi:four helix bundle protein